MKNQSSRPVIATEINQSLIPAAARRRVLASALALAFAAIPTISSATHSWSNYHWARKVSPFTLQLGDNVSSIWDAHLQKTSLEWSTPTADFTGPKVLETTVVTGATDPKRCKPTNGMVQVCNSKYGRNGWLGIAQIWVSSSHITQGAVKVNDTYFNMTAYNTVAWRNLVMCQEVGHTFGLDHQDENFSNANLGTCMDYTNDPNSNQHPNQHDYDELATIYSHVDGSNSYAASMNVAAMPRDMREGDFSERSDWGALVRSRNNGLREVYRRDFGGGYQVVTFVIWAEGEGRGRH